MAAAGSADLSSDNVRKRRGRAEREAQRMIRTPPPNRPSAVRTVAAGSNGANLVLCICCIHCETRVHLA